jgi:hypothetical protein
MQPWPRRAMTWPNKGLTPCNLCLDGIQTPQRSAEGRGRRGRGRRGPREGARKCAAGGGRARRRGRRRARPAANRAGSCSAAGGAPSEGLRRPRPVYPVGSRAFGNFRAPSTPPSPAARATRSLSDEPARPEPGNPSRSRINLASNPSSRSAGPADGTMAGLAGFPAYGPVAPALTVRDGQGRRYRAPGWQARASGAARSGVNWPGRPRQGPPRARAPPLHPPHPPAPAGAAAPTAPGSPLRARPPPPSPNQSTTPRTPLPSWSSRGAPPRRPPPRAPASPP